MDDDFIYYESLRIGISWVTMEYSGFKSCKALNLATYFVIHLWPSDAYICCIAFSKTFSIIFALILL